MISLQTPRTTEDTKQLINDLHQNHMTSAIAIMIKSYGISEKEAQSLFVDALIVLKDKLDQGKLEHKRFLKSYLIGIMKNLWREKRRKNQKLRCAEQSVKDSLQIEADTCLFESADLINLGPILNRLCSKHRRILELFYVDGCSLKEIAIELGYGSAGVVKNLKFRALNKCRVSAHSMGYTRMYA